MHKPLATLGIFAVTGTIALCDLCGSSTPGRTSSFSLVPAAHAATLPAHVPSDAQPPTTPTPVTSASAAQQVAASQTITFTVKGMTCAGCVLSTRKVLTRLPGVAKADVSYEKGTAVVTFDPAKVTEAQMIAAIKTLGYTATKVTR
ncbi:heavy-metal-associated domain-containing protein [Gemmatimonas sp. UBA7669]|uniref:heavy-metal-associated domain-containing protein n=1 Tax=Gemmatimonas sp. UBA7669 TaxID=1946568 RepID=UPI0025BC4E5E|nr:heavy-metal-associated domain-containing protein [Gemmatimonas sp. UBA7669]